MVSLNGWSIQDELGNTKALKPYGSLPSGESIRLSHDSLEGRLLLKNDGTTVASFLDEISPQVFIAAAFINPPGRDRKANEWVSIANYSTETIDLSNWTIEHVKNGRKRRASLKDFTPSLSSGETLRF